MAYEVPKFLRREEDALLYNGDGTFIFYVPEIFFDRKDAIIVGEYVNLIGILDYALFDKSGKQQGKFHRFFFPTVFLTKPCRIEKQKGLQINPNNHETSDYRLLIYEKDDAVIVSTKVPQDITYVEDFFKIFLTGKLPTTTIDYAKMQEYFTESIKLNGSSYNLNIQMFGLVLQAVCRDPNHLDIPFRLTKYTNPTSYKLINIRDVPKYISPSVSITSENWDNGVVGAIMHPTDVESPMEKLIMGFD